MHIPKSPQESVRRFLDDFMCCAMRDVVVSYMMICREMACDAMLRYVKLRYVEVRRRMFCCVMSNVKCGRVKCVVCLCC